MFQIFGVLTIIFWKNFNLLEFDDMKTRVKVLCQAIIGGLMMLCLFEAINKLPIGDFSAIAFSSPCFTMILASFFLKERCGVFRVIIGCLLISGVVVISRPTILFGDLKTTTNTLTDTFNTSDKNVGEDTRKHMDNTSEVVGALFAVATAVLSALVSILAKYTPTKKYFFSLLIP